MKKRGGKYSQTNKTSPNMDDCGLVLHVSVMATRAENEEKRVVRVVANVITKIKERIDHVIALMTKLCRIHDDTRVFAHPCLWCTVVRVQDER